MNLEERLRTHILGALRLPGADVSDANKLAAHLASYLADHVDGVAALLDRGRGIWVNVYEVTRHYGGHEEGGWYYNAGNPVHSEKCETEEDAEAMKVKLTKLYADRVEGNIYSVHGGTAIDVLIEESEGVPWPTETPHYE